MFDVLLVLLSVLGLQFTAYEDCTVAFEGPVKNTPIVRYVESFNDLPDEQRFALCNGS